MLIRAKDCVKKIKRLKWQDWLSRNIKMPRSTASRYVKCTERFKNVAPAKHLNLSKLTVSKMFELLSVPKDKLEQFFTDAERRKLTIQNMTKNELRNFIKDWKQNNIPQKPKKKFVVRFSIAEQDGEKFAEILQDILDKRTLSDDSLQSIESALKSFETTKRAEVSETVESNVCNTL